MRRNGIRWLGLSFGPDLLTDIIIAWEDPLLFYFYGNYPSLVTSWTDGWVSVVKDDWLALSVFPLIDFAPLPFSLNSSVQCCGSEFVPSRIRIFSIPDPNFFHPGSASTNLSILKQKIVAQLSEKLSRLFIPDPDPDFLPIPDFGYRGQKSTRSRIRIHNNTWVYKRYGVPGSWYIPVTSSMY